jgi:hypothetical protein
MPNSDLFPSLLFTLNENQLALEAAIMAYSAAFRTFVPASSGSRESH